MYDSCNYMLQYSIRIAKRFAVLIPGIIIAYFSVRDIFPYLDSRLPLSLALFFTYVLGAYVLIPAIIRGIRIIKPPKHLPLYCVTPDGFASDPLNIGIVSDRFQLIQAMQAAGWYIADQHTPKNILHSVVSTLLMTHYPNAPVSSLFLFGRKQDIAFEIPIEGSRGNRHHVRFWATTYSNKKELSARSISWRRRKTHVRSDHLLWVGAASLDAGIRLIRHNFQITHMIAPDTDSERTLIISQMSELGLVASSQNVILGKPYRLINRVWRGYLNTDGMMSVITIKPKN